MAALSQETTKGSKETKTEPGSRVKVAQVSTYLSRDASLSGRCRLALYTLEHLLCFAFSETENKALI